MENPQCLLRLRVLAEREAQRLGCGLARTDAPSDHVIDLDDGLDSSIGGELESTIQVRIRAEPHLCAGPDILDEDLLRLVLVNPNVAVFVEDPKALAPVLVPCLCRRLPYHAAPPFVVCGWVLTTQQFRIRFLNSCVIRTANDD